MTSCLKLPATYAQPPVVLGDVVGIEPGSGRHRPGGRDRRDVQPGRAVHRGEEFRERSDPALPSDKLVASGRRSGIPPVMMT